MCHHLANLISVMHECFLRKHECSIFRTEGLKHDLTSVTSELFSYAEDSAALGLHKDQSIV